MDKKGIVMKVVILLLTIFGPYLLVTFFVGAGGEEANRLEDVYSGREVVVKIDGRNQIIDVEQFIAGELAAEYVNSPEEIEKEYKDGILQAKAVMLRTEIYNKMGEKEIAEEANFSGNYLSMEELSKSWGAVNFTEYWGNIAAAVLDTYGEVENKEK